VRSGFLLLFLGCSALPAQTIIIKAARLFDGRSDRLQSPGLVIVSGQRIESVGGGDVIKVCATGGVLLLNDDADSPQLTQEELNALVDQAHSMRKKAAAHAHGAEGGKRAIRAGIDSIEHGSFLDDEALKMMLDRGTYFVPSLMAAQSLRDRLASGAKLDPRVMRKAKMAIDSH
jgi:imidazolonepropionase-like amidohydrolase